MEKYITVGEASKRLGVSSETLRRWDKSGKFNCVRHPINNYRVYTSNDVETLALDLDFDAETYQIKPVIIKEKKTYFQTKLGKLYAMDSIELLRKIEDETVDLVFADPPYNIKKAEWDSFQSQKEYVDWSLLWITESARILKKTGSLYICGFSEILADIKWSASHLFKGCKWLVWYYRNKANMGKDWGRSHESILHFRKSKNLKFNIDDVRIPYNSHTLKYPVRNQAKTSQYGNGKDYIWQPNPKGAKPKDVFEIPTISNHAWERYKHPTQKPIELLKKCILASSHEKDIVVDPFGGSGTTFAVAEAYNRKWYGSELDKAYCQIIKERLCDKKHIDRIRNGTDEFQGNKRRQKLRGSSN